MDGAGRRQGAGLVAPLEGRHQPSLAALGGEARKLRGGPAEVGVDEPQVADGIGEMGVEPGLQQ